MKDKIVNYILIIFIAMVILIGSGIVSAGNTIIPYNAQVQYNSTAISKGNATFFIYDLSSGGAELYKENFNDSISQGLLQVMLGYQNISLALTAGNIYWLDVSINGIDTNATVNGTNSNRFPFVASVSSFQPLNISKLIVNGNDVDDAMNVTGGAYIGGAIVVNDDVTINNPNKFTLIKGKLLIDKNDIDDALNLSVGGLYVAGNSVFNKFFNITTTTSSVITNGTLTITNADSDDALNVSAGGTYVGGNLMVAGSITGGGGLASQNDVEWILVTWQNFTTRIDGSVKVGNLPASNEYIVEYILWHEPRRTDNNATEPNSKSSIGMRINNVTTASAYSNLVMNGAGTISAFSASSFNLTYWELIPQNGGFSFNTLIVKQLGANQTMVDSQGFSLPINQTTTSFYAGQLTNVGKISDFSFYGEPTDSSGTGVDLGEINGTIKVYAHRSFNKY